MKRNEKLKRGSAMVLSFILAFQSVFMGMGGIAKAEEANQAGSPIDIKSSGNPPQAFDKLTLTVGKKVGADNTVHFKVDGKLSNDYLMEMYEQYAYDTDKGMDEADWEKDKQGFTTYEDFLNAREDGELKQITASFSFTDQVAGGTESLFALDTPAEGSFQTDAGLNVGSYTLSRSGNQVNIKLSVNRYMFSKLDITFGVNMSMELSEAFKADTDVTFKPGTGGGDFILTLPEDGKESLGDTGYTITKTAADVAEGDTSIHYTINAEAVGTGARAFDMASVSQASKSEASVSQASKSQASVSEASPSKAELKEKEERKEEAQKTIKKALKKLQKKNNASNSETAFFDNDFDDYQEFYNFCDEYDFGEFDWKDFIGLFNEDNEEIFYSLFPAAPRAKAAGSGTLAGVKILDKIPTGLTLQKAVVKLDGGAAIPLYEGGKSVSSSCTYEDGQFIYTISESSTEVKTAEVQIDTALSDELYNSYMISGKAFEQTFSNRASLKDNTDKLVAISDSVSSTIKLAAPFGKNGAPLDGTNRSFEWTLDVQSGFSNKNTVLYVVDHICDVENTHNYRIPDGVTLRDGETGTTVSYPMETISPSDPANYAYEKVDKISVVNEIFTKAGKTPKDNTAYIYTYPVGSSGQKDAVMLIPLSKYKNKELTLTYYTDVPEREEYTSVETELKNDAKMLWKWPTGVGPGPGDFGGASIDKSYPVRYDLVKKTAYNPMDPERKASFDDGTNEVTWYFEVNQLGKEITSLDITDEFTDSELLLTSDLGTGKDLVLNKLMFDPETKTVISSGTELRIPYAAAGAPGNHYELTKADGKTAFKLHMETIGTDDHYLFSLKTFVNTTKPGSAGNSFEVENTAQVAAVVDGDPVDLTLNAKCPVYNSYIRKDAIPSDGGGSYNYADHTVKWKVRVNLQSKNIYHPVITDTLPEGTKLKEITSVVYDGTAYTAAANDADKWNITIPGGGSSGDTDFARIEQTDNTDPSSSPYWNKKFEVQFAGSEVPIGKQMTIEFTTEVQEEYRKAKFKSQPGERNLDLNNKVDLTGKLGKTDGPDIKAVDTAVHKLVPDPLTKSGQYHKLSPCDVLDTIPQKNVDADYISWTIFVNRAAVDMAGVVLTDDLRERDFMELIPMSLKVETVKLDASGKVSEAAGDTVNVTSKGGFANIDGSSEAVDEFGFKYTIPDGEGIKNSTLRITFNTVMVNDAYASDITNNVSLSGTGVSDESGNANVVDKRDFYLSDYATARNMYFVKIYKTSQNESGRFPLTGTEFKIEKLKTPSGGSTDLTDWKTLDPSKTDKTRKTNKRGTTSFMFLDEGAMYRITETKANTGYLKPEKCWYVVPMKKAGITYPAEVGVDEPINKTNPQDAVIVNDNVKKHYADLDIKNNVATGADSSLSFIKKGQGGQILEGVKFTLSSKRLSERTFTSDDTGKVTFPELDPLPSGEYYTIKEKTPPTGYKAANSFQARVFVNDRGTVTAEFTGSNIPTKGDGGTDYMLQNTPITQSGSFKKVDQNGDLLKEAGIKFKVERRGDGGQKLKPSSGWTEEDKASGKVQVVVDVDKASAVDAPSTYCPYIPQEVLTNENGVIKFTDFLYGDYRLTEEATGLPLVTTDATVLYLHIDGNGVYVSKKCNENGTVPTNTKLGSNYSVENKLHYGFVDIHKVLAEKDESGKLNAVKDADGNVIPLSGLKFDIYRDTNNNGNLDSGEPKVMTLTTDETGHFGKPSNWESNTDGSYNGQTRQLVVGNYLLKEQEPAEYVHQSNAYPFVIEEWDESKPKVVYVGNDSSTPVTESSLFLNEPSRSEVSLSKVDSERTSTRLHGAEFEIYTGLTGANGCVANLTEDGNTGTYKLAIPSSAASENVRDEDSIGREYLRKDTDGKLKLLCGTYYLQETKAPQDYKPLTERLKMTVTKTGAEVTQGGTTSVMIKNTLISRSVSLVKYLETRKASGKTTVHGSYAPKADFKFQLRGTSENGESYDSGTVTTDTDGKITFSNIPAGTYTLKEVPESGTITDNVDLMPDVTVIVTTEGVTFKNSEGTSISSAETPDALRRLPVTNTIGNGTGNAKLTVRNHYKLGSAEGIKNGVFTRGTEKTTTLLDGAVFTLTNKDDPLMVLTCTSGDKNTLLLTTDPDTGTVKFENVPYGNYTLEETSVPAGYKKMAPKDVTINGDGISLSDAEKKLLNETMNKSVWFLKTDQNGEPLSSERVKTTFTVTRQELTDGSPSMPEFTPIEVTNDESGIVKINGLPYGTYQVEETKAEPEVVGADSMAEPFYITVGKGDGGESVTRVSIGTVVSGLTPCFMELPDYIGEAENTAAFNFSDFSGSGEWKLWKVKNSLNYSLVDVVKVAADDSGDGSGSVTPKKTSFLEGVIFKVYDDVNKNTLKDDADKEVLTLITGSDGRFIKNDAGQYWNGTGSIEKGEGIQPYRLVYGRSYLIHEESLGTDILAGRYSMDPGYYAFEVNQEALGKTYYVGTDKESVKPGELGVALGTDGEAYLFPNGPLCRGTVILNKTDRETDEPLEGAAFDIFVNDGAAVPVKAAELKDNGSGSYILAPGEGYSLVNPAGQEYLKKQADGTYELIGGNYYIKETKAPDSYELPQDFWYFKIYSEQKQIVNANLTDRDGLEKVFTNTLARQKVVVHKQVERFEKGQWRDALAEDGTFTFRLKGTPSNASLPIDQTETVALPDSQAIFEDIPSGEYELTEEITGNDGLGRPMSEVYIPAQPVNVKINENGVLYNGLRKEAQTVENALKRGNVSAVKIAADGKGEVKLPGAVFELSSLDKKDFVAAAVSDSSGAIVFKDIPLGEYELYETEAPEGYVISGRKMTVQLTEEGSTVTTGLENDTVEELNFYNQILSGITIEKLAEEIDDQLSGTMKPGAGFLFKISGTSMYETPVEELFDSLTIEGAGEARAEKDGGEKAGIYLTTGPEGIIRVNGLPAGEYTVEELENEKNSAAGAYVRDPEIQTAVIEIDRDTMMVKKPDVLFENQLKRAEIKGLKTKEDGKTPLAGAVIGIFPATTAEFTENTLYKGQKAVSDENGVFSFKQIPIGEYWLCEMEAPEGWQLDKDQMFRVNVTEDGQVVTSGEGVKGLGEIIISNKETEAENPGEDNPGEDNPGEDKPGEENPGEDKPGDNNNPGNNQDTGDSHNSGSTGNGKGPQGVSQNVNDNAAGPGVPNTEAQITPEIVTPTEDMPKLSVEPQPDGGTDIIIPEEIVPGTRIHIYDQNGDGVYDGITGEDSRIHVQLPAGDYVLIAVDDEGVPLAQMLFTIDPEETPLAAADTGDHSLPAALLATIMLGALAGAVIMLYQWNKYKEEDGDEEAVFRGKEHFVKKRFFVRR